MDNGESHKTPYDNLVDTMQIGPYDEYIEFYRDEFDFEGTTEGDFLDYIEHIATVVYVGKEILIVDY